jgi:putative ABC transport system permease protein
MIRAVKNQVYAVDKDQPMYDIRTMDQVIADSQSSPRFNLIVIAIFAVVALALAGVGIYGVISYAVTQRTREIGIRMALGAQPAGLQSMFVRQGLVLAAVGAAIGLAAAVGLTRLMSSILFKTTALDPITYAGVSVLLILAAALASYVPARRATEVDPLEALRTE